MKFVDFVNEQVSRLEAVPGFQMGDAGRKELAAWFIEKCGDGGASSSPNARCNRTGSAEWLREDQSARNIKAVIDECVEFATAPGLADVKAVWYRIYPPISSHARCGACNGTGYVIVEKGGVEGAAKCNSGV